MSAKWSDANREFYLLHQMNKLRIPYILDHWGGISSKYGTGDSLGTSRSSHLCRYEGGPSFKGRPLEGVKVLDVGCGGGILSLVR